MNVDILIQSGNNLEYQSWVVVFPQRYNIQPQLIIRRIWLISMIFSQTSPLLFIWVTSSRQVAVWMSWGVAAESMMEKAAMVLFIQMVMVSRPISYQLFRFYTQFVNFSLIWQSGVSRVVDGVIFMSNFCLKLSIKGWANLLCYLTKVSSWKSKVSVLRYQQMENLRCWAKWPQISASTAVLQSASIGISPVLRCLTCLLNQLLNKKASAGDGTANTFLYGVLIVFPSSVMRNLHNLRFLLMHGMFFIEVGLKSSLLVEPLHVVLLVTDLGAESCPIFQHRYHHHYNLGSQEGMKYLRGLLSPRSYEINLGRVENMFGKMRLYGTATLHTEYYRILGSGLRQAEDEGKCMKTVISKLDSLQEVEEIVKLFTVIHRLLIEKNYSGVIVDCLENAEMAVGREFSFSMEQYGWFVPFYRKYVFYLAKLSSNADIYIKAAMQIPFIQKEQYLNHFFRILNQLPIILLPFNNTIKTVGRYFKQLKVFQEFYKVIQLELVNIYNYLRVLIDGIMRDYEKMSVEELSTFVQATPDYELMVDQLEELLMSKYFHKGKKLQQPYIRAEDIAKINYDIQCRKKARGLKSPRK